MQPPFESRLISHWPPGQWSDVTLLLAVSGGADSMALLRAMHSLRRAAPGNLIAAHFNHRLRGQESDDDELFVREACANLQIPFQVGFSENQRLTSEDAARSARYEFLSTAAKKLGARYVATAHTADDQVETILHRILRGTGFDGLAGIPRTRELVPGISLIRPILWATRPEILNYLADINQPYRRDSSNDQTRFTRNRIRNDLIPTLETYNPRVKEALLRLGQLAAESQTFVSKLVEPAYRNVVTDESTRVRILCEPLRQLDPYLVRQLFTEVWRQRAWPMQEMTADHWRHLAELALQPFDAGMRATFPNGIDATRLHDELILQQLDR